MAALCAASPAARNSALPTMLPAAVDVDVRLVEQAEYELLPQQARCGDIDAVFGNLAAAGDVDQQAGDCLAAELVDARVQAP